MKQNIRVVVVVLSINVQVVLKVKCEITWPGSNFVMTYNQVLFIKYDAHINVEVCSIVQSVKYKFKNVYKDHDRAKVDMCFENKMETHISTLAK